MSTDDPSYNYRELDVLEFTDGKRITIRAAWADNRAAYAQLVVSRPKAQSPYVLSIPRWGLEQVRRAIEEIEKQQPNDDTLPRHGAEHGVPTMRGVRGRTP